jgi:hypothetical protein
VAPAQPYLNWGRRRMPDDRIRAKHAFRKA